MDILINKNLFEGNFMNILSLILLLIVLQGVPEDKNAERYLQEGLSLEEQDKPEEALRLWGQAVGELAVPSVAIATGYLRLSTEHELSDSYRAASFHYLWGMSGTGGTAVKDNKPALEKELARLDPLLDRSTFNHWQALLKDNDPALFDEILRFWKWIDPTPATKYNERLIEHWQRIAYARKHFTRKNDPPYGTDDRGFYYVKYGEADRVDSGSIHITDDKIRSVITQLIPNINIPPEDRRTDYVMIMSSRISNLFINPEYELWIYGAPDEHMSENLILIFGNKSGSFGRLQALEDFMPNPAFSLSVFKKGIDTGAPIVPPGMVLQYIYYEHFATKDPYFAQQFRNFLSSVGSGKGDRPPEAILAWQHKQKHVLDNRQILNTAPDEFSTEAKKVPEIPLDVYQYRLLDENDQPVFATFLESHPLRAFFGDFAANQDAMLATPGDTAEDLTGSYKLIHGLQLRNEQWELIGRNRQPVPLVFDPNQNHPISSVFVVPYGAGNITQVFYAGLKNLHPHSKPRTESLFPDSLRGLGKLHISQPDPLTVSPGEMTVGDIIIGYQRKEQPEDNSLFDFVAANDRRIPEGENLVVYFEVYHLQTGPNGLSRFEVDYEIRPRGGLFGWTRKKRDEFSITLNFEQSADRFAESLEIEATGLEAGKYELTWTIHDLQTGQTHEQHVPFEVVEEVEQ